jgi:hypothetical protein
MRLPKRFALSTLLLLMLVVASVFGYAQWRRQWLKAEIEKLNRESDPLLNGRTLPLYDHWFWPTVPDYCSAVIRDERHGKYFADGKTMSSAEAKEYLSNKADRLHAIGVKHVVYGLLIPDNRRIPPEVRITMLKDLSELDAE